MARYAPISRQDFLEIQLGGVFKRKTPDTSRLKQYPICKMERSITPTAPVAYGVKRKNARCA